MTHMYYKDEVFMQRCLKLAQKGAGSVSPNPLVGCVIVHEGVVIGEGFHEQYGQAHAEVNAINAVKDIALLSGSTLYVNLEPCAHYGKTPPCADLIIKHKIPKVIIACTDSYTEVAGRGIARLKEQGCDVTVGVLEKESRFLNRRFFTYHEKKRPYIILKWAQTKDGFIDVKRTPNSPQKPNWITSPETRCVVHKWRAQEDAIMVGTNTAFADNPSLTVRDWYGKNPLRIVPDKDLKLPQSLDLFNKEATTLILNAHDNKTINNLEYVKVGFDDTLLTQICQILYSRQGQSLIIEGGAKLLNSFILNNLWDEARVFVGDVCFKTGLKAPVLALEPSENYLLGKDGLMFFYNSSF